MFDACFSACVDVNGPQSSFFCRELYLFNTLKIIPEQLVLRGREIGR